MRRRPRLGAYVLAADPTWIRTSVGRYYEYLDVLVVSASASGSGWTGAPIESERCLEALVDLDDRGIVRVVKGEWINPADPLAADTEQRRSALAAVGLDVDWVLQFDTDEVLPDVEALLEVLSLADESGVEAVEWPMRVLFRRLKHGRFLEVVGPSGGAHYEYPGPIAVRPDVTLVEARRVNGPFLRPIVSGDDHSLQVTRPAGPGEIREPLLSPDHAALHNSWARSPRVVRKKVRSWGHGGTWRASAYYWTVWWPAPVTWRWLRSFHPFAKGLWPRLGVRMTSVELDPRDK